jgi:hypothetical protein
MDWKYKHKIYRRIIAWDDYVTELYDRPSRPETLEVEYEEVDTEVKDSRILQSEVEKSY